MNVSRIAVLLCCLTLAMPLCAQDKKAAPSKAADSNMQSLAGKIKADKKLVVAHNMNLNDADGKKFWPVYDSYQKDLAGIYDGMAKVITEYADAYNKNSFNDAVAKKLTTEVLAIEEAELKLRKMYAERVTNAVSATAAARFLQVENKIRAMVNYELAAGIPLIP